MTVSGENGATGANGTGENGAIRDNSKARNRLGWSFGTAPHAAESALYGFQCSARTKVWAPPKEDLKWHT